MTGFLGVVGVLLSLGSVSPQILQRDGGPENAPVLTVATPTYGSDGSKLGAQATFSLTVGKAQVLFAGAGSSLCESASATPSAPADGGLGWRLEVLPRELTKEGVLVVNVAWQRLGPDGGGQGWHRHAPPASGRPRPTGLHRRCGEATVSGNRNGARTCETTETSHGAV